MNKNLKLLLISAFVTAIAGYIEFRIICRNGNCEDM